MPQKLTTTACFIQEESSGGKQFRNCLPPVVGRPTVRKMLEKKFDGIFVLEAGNPRKNIV